MKTHQDMRAPRHISIWLGSMTDEDQLDAYLSETFAEDFGFEIYEPDGPEATAQSETSVRELLTGFSAWRYFVDAAVAAASAAGIDKASSAIVFYNFIYDPALIKNSKAPYVYIGAIPYAIP